MVYITSWQEYQEAAEALYARSPNTTRYCVKWNASEAKLVLKITDNTTCIKFKTYSSIFLNRFEALNLSLLRKMQNRKHPEPAPPSAPTPGAAAADNIESASKAPVPSAQGGGVKKKKPKKKK